MSPNAGNMTALLAGFLGRRASGLLVIGVAVVGGLVGIFAAPELEDTAAHAAYEPFFSATAQLAAGIFIVLAVEARYVTSNIILGLATVLSVGAAAVGAVVGLLPDLCQSLYDAAFAAVTGGGLAALVSTASLAVAALGEARLTQRQEVVASLRQLADELANQQAEHAEKNSEQNG
jgi:hypothetical protein